MAALPPLISSNKRVQLSSAFLWHFIGRKNSGFWLIRNVFHPGSLKVFETSLSFQQPWIRWCVGVMVSTKGQAFRLRPLGQRRPLEQSRAATLTGVGCIDWSALPEMEADTTESPEGTSGQILYRSTLCCTNVQTRAISTRSSLAVSYPSTVLTKCHLTIVFELGRIQHTCRTAVSNF